MELVSSGSGMHAVVVYDLGEDGRFEIGNQGDIFYAIVLDHVLNATASAPQLDLEVTAVGAGRSSCSSPIKSSTLLPSTAVAASRVWF